VPAEILKKLGIKPLTKEEFRLANGELIVRKRGIALFKYGKKIGGADVIFGEKDDSNLLGVSTLESLGLALDPLKRELKPLPMILAGYSGQSRFSGILPTITGSKTASNKKDNK
jgi:predicted aspartyl protease